MNPQHFASRRRDNHFAIRRTFLRRKASGWGMLWCDGKTYVFRPKKMLPRVLPIIYRRADGEWTSPDRKPGVKPNPDYVPA